SSVSLSSFFAVRCASGGKVRSSSTSASTDASSVPSAYAVRCDAPLQCLAARNALRAHHDILRARDTDDLLQTRRSAGAGDLAELLLGQRVKAGLRDNAEVAGQRYLETDAEGV